MEISSPEHTNDLDVLKKMEDEHLRLQRQVRMIQTDRMQRTMGVHPQFRSQDELLRCLKSEYRNLCKDLKIARSGAHKKKDKKMKQDLKDALVFRLQQEQECEAGLIVTNQIEDLLVRKDKDTEYLRQIAHTARGQINKRRIQSERRLISTENRLETAQLRFNSVQFENNKIREEIEHMLKDRALFNQAWNKMLTALNKGKKFLGDLFESSTLAYDMRDEWVAKLKSIQEKGKIDQMMQIQEMRDLMKAYNHEMKLYQFLAIKGITRVNKKQEIKDEKERKKEEEKTLVKYQYHLQILEDIFAFTDKVSTKDITREFDWWEQQIDSTYKLLTDCCAEIEVLRRDVQRLRQEARDRQDFNASVEDRIEKRLAQFQEELDQRRANKEKLFKKNEDSLQVLKTTINQITDIFNILGCSVEPYQNLLGDKGPSIYQFKLTLLLVTEKIKEYKETVYFYERYLQKTQKPDKTASRIKKYTVRADHPVQFTPTTINTLLPADPCPACVETRWFSRIIDGIQAPLSREEVLQALVELSSDPAYLKSDRIHTLTDCKVPRSRALLARRYMNY